MATTPTSTSTREPYKKVSTGFVYSNMGHATTNPVVRPVTDQQALSVRPATPISYNVPKRSLDLARSSITEEYIAHGLDLSKKGLNAAKVAGCEVNNADVAANYLWTSNKIVAVINAMLRNQEEQAQQAHFFYESEAPGIHFTIEHNHNTFKIQQSVMVKQEDGTWKNDLVDITYVDENTMEINLSEPSHIMVVVEKLGE